MNARFFPYITVIGIFVASVFLLFDSIKGKDKRMDEVIPKLGPKAIIRVVGVIFVMFGYIAMMYAVGYKISTPLAIFVLMRYYGMKRWGIVIFVSGAVTLILHFIFYNFMGVVLPEGRLFR
jgi:hypothetical protein